MPSSVGLRITGRPSGQPKGRFAPFGPPLNFNVRRPPHMVRFIILPLRALPAIAQAQRSAEAEDLCFGQASHPEIRACLKVQAKASEQALRAAEANVLAALERWEQEPSYKSRGKEALKASSRAFDRMRQAQCEFQATLAAGGNGSGERRLLCEVELNRQRVAELQAVVASLP